MNTTVDEHIQKYVFMPQADKPKMDQENYYFLCYPSCSPWKGQQHREGNNLQGKPTCAMD